MQCDEEYSCGLVYVELDICSMNLQSKLSLLCYLLFKWDFLLMWICWT